MGRLGFVLYSVLQPFAVKVSLISLGPAAVIGAAFFTIRSEIKSRHAQFVG